MIIENKHAYLIMAHHRMDLLYRLINALDYPNNDIFIHIDKKCQESIKIETQYSKVYMIERTDVRWGGYSQIKCELLLLNAALNSGNHYLYYHLLTGASYPIKDNGYIIDFFSKHHGKEFIGFDLNYAHYYGRVKNHYCFSEMGKPSKKSDLLKLRVRSFFIKFENLFGIDHFKRFNMEFRKGLVYWSITENCARYICKNEKIIHDMLNKSISGDEVFVQTLVYNSPYRENIYNINHEFEGSLFCVAWESCLGETREGQNFINKDYYRFFNRNFLYALKFEGADGIDLIDRVDTEILHK